MSKKSCICGWSLFLAICLLLVGVIIGSIGAAKYAPMASFLNNAKPTTCTLQASMFTISRCTKWNSCIAVNWNVSYPDLALPSTTRTAIVTDKYGVGYWDAAANRASRSVGESSSCFINSMEPNMGYFVKPVQNYRTMLIIGWVFVLIGIIPCVLFGMVMCCDIPIHHIFKCDCDCDCGGSSSKPSTSNPLYNTGANAYSGNYYGNTTTTTTTTTSNYGGSAYPDPETASDAEMTPIPATGAAAYETGAIAQDDGSASTSDSTERSNNGGAGVTTTTHDNNWGGYAE